MSEKIVDIQTLVQDDHNFNKGRGCLAAPLLTQQKDVL